MIFRIFRLEENTCKFSLQATNEVELFKLLCVHYASSLVLSPVGS